MADLCKIKEEIFKSDNKACFIERERILSRLETEMKDYNKPDKYAIILSKLLSEVSTPIHDCDFFAGRVVESLPDASLSVPSTLLCSVGHMSFDYRKVLEIGLKGIHEEIKINSAKKGDEKALAFAKNAEIVINSIYDFCVRYATAAESKGFSDMAKAANCSIVKA